MYNLHFFFFFLASLRGLWDLSFLISFNPGPSSESAES